MNARLSEGNVLRTAKRIFGLAGLAALTLVCAGPARAQSNPAQTESTAARSAAAVPGTSPGVGPSGSTPVAQPVVAQNSPAKPRAPKGQSEGIKVHGHWTIEVRNPDGKVVSHTEFENALNLPQAILANVLTGRTTVGTWEIVLGTNNNTGGPCGSSGANLCTLAQSTSFLAPVGLANCSTDSGCFATLQVGFAPIALGATPNVVQLTGQATANANSQIGYVETDLYTCATNGVGLSTIDPNSCFTSGPKFSSASGMLTSAKIFPGSPVPVGPTQIISVTVQISFQ